MNIFYKLYNYFFLLLILILTHYIPLERSSLAPDDYSLINNNIIGLLNFIKFPDRPILYLWLELQYQILDLNINVYFLILILANYLLILSTYFLYKEFFESNNALILSVINLLIFFKLEIFHNSIMIHICLVTTLYIISTILLIKYLKTKKNFFLLFSILLYLISIFWYEIGFFLPIIIFFYNSKFNLKLEEIKKNLSIFFPYLIIMLIYSILRITNIFGISLTESSYSINLNIVTALYEYFNHIFGRYAIKNILYGFYKFFYSDLKYTIFLLVINILIIFLIYKKFILTNKIKNQKFFFIIFLIFSSLPVLLNASAGGRNLILISIPISYFIFILFKKLQNKIVLLIFFLLLIINQGNAWSQYIATKLQFSILDSIENNKNEILKYDNLIINMKSFTEKIPHSFLKNDYNLLNTYYGFQVWELWGFSGYLEKNKININLIVIDEDPIYLDTKVKLSKIISIENYNKKNENIILNKNSFYLIDYSNTNISNYLNLKR